VKIHHFEMNAKKGRVIKKLKILDIQSIEPSIVVDEITKRKRNKSVHTNKNIIQEEILVEVKKTRKGSLPLILQHLPIAKASILIQKQLLSFKRQERFQSQKIYLF
jgi:hypothetical protein